ncbi:MAG: HDOD domain-containing protein [Pseudomonadota bacterium]
MYQWLQRLFSGSPSTPAPQPPAAPAMTPATPAASEPASAPRGVSFEQKDNVNSNYYNWLFDAQDESDLDTNPLETQVLDTLAAAVKSQQSSTMVRRLPGLIPQLLQSLRSDNFSSAQLSRTISHDVVLVAAVIRLANSSLLGTGVTITSVEHAVMVIGQEGLRQLITGVAFRPIIDMNSGVFTRTLAPRIWDQSERCAVAMRTLAEEMGIDPFEAFLAGLVQHVGLIVTLRTMDQVAKDGKQLGSAMFCASLLRDARTLTCNIGREWNFSPAVTVAIGEQGSMRKGVTMSPLGTLLSLSDYLSKTRILVEQARLAEGDTRLFKGLSKSALDCYHGLDAVEGAELHDADAEHPQAGSAALS